MDRGQAFDLKVSIVMNCSLLTSPKMGHFFEHINMFRSFFNMLAPSSPTGCRTDAQPLLSYALICSVMFQCIFSYIILDEWKFQRVQIKGLVLLWV
jgi:hypothetical protein